MARVTKFGFYLDDGIKTKMDLVVERVTIKNPKRDAVLLIEGNEGDGKSNMSVGLAYYFKEKTGRDVTIFFRLKPLINFLKSTENQIAIWDEPSLDSLSTDSLNKLNKDLIRLLMTIRKRRHILFINITKFYKFNEYVVVDRPVCLIHCYSRNEIIPGRFFYIRKRALEHMFNAYKKSKERDYKKWASLMGSFPEVMENYYDQMGINICDQDTGKIIHNTKLSDYEAQKDKAIMSIGEETNINNPFRDDAKILRQNLKELKGRLGAIVEYPIKNKSDLARRIGVAVTTLNDWNKAWLELEKELKEKEAATPPREVTPFKEVEV